MDKQKYLHQMPNYNQRDVGICYAYAAIQLVDYWRQTMFPNITKDISLSNPSFTISCIEHSGPHNKDSIQTLKKLKRN